ncbi:MAG TPA: DNA helicase UvrBC [Planctomycetaceae bacterium]|nr:DNA helicase UvrBC [Planctomycetaceae bacterium]HRF00520.1 UvrB/UvrC motif-containing protein [Pirellulaceae bacterium]
MSDHDNIDFILEGWEYEPTTVNARLVQGDDGRDVIQMRVDLGVLQMETSGRPDGTRPEGFESVLERLRARVAEKGTEYELTEEECFDIDREFVQYYHRRICWLQLRRFEQAIQDADHTLGLMDLCRDHSPDEAWMLAHEQYRPFVLFHRIQAEALVALEEGEGAEAAVEVISLGLERLAKLFASYESTEAFEDDDIVRRLTEIREDIRERYGIGKTLRERLEAAVADEQYELAAKLRDELARRNFGPR